jgi:PIN domain nuclease of toxin-antitoxin system
VKLLADTQVWLWQLGDRKRLDPTALAMLEDPSHEVWLSAASVWELVIKAQLGKIQLPLPVDQYVPSRLAALGIGSCRSTTRMRSRYCSYRPSIAIRSTGCWWLRRSWRGCSS